MLRLRVRVHPGASRDRVALEDDASLAVWLRARPIEGRANAALLELLAAALKVRQREVALVWGERSRTKVVEVPFASLEEVSRRLSQRGR